MTELSVPTPCIVCNMQPEPAVPRGVTGQSHNHAYGATNFETGGHYGSTFYDPANPMRRLSLNVCDECLRRLAKEGKVLEVTRTPCAPTTRWNTYENTPEQAND